MSTQLTLSEAAKILKVSEKSIRRYIKAGRMRANLIKGQKGYEYRIDKNQLKVLEKPPRGKNSHRTTRKQTSKQTSKQKVKKSSVETRGRVSKKPVKKAHSVKPLESVGEIIKKKIKARETPAANSQRPDVELVNYKSLYENLLVKYEQTLLMLGALEAQVSNRTTPVNNGKIEKMEDSLAKQEDIIMDLYQTLQLYKNDQAQY